MAEKSSISSSMADGPRQTKESPVRETGLRDDTAGKRQDASRSASPGKGKKSHNGVGKSNRKSSGTNVAAKNAISLAVVIGSGQHGGERQHGGVRPTQDAGTANRPDDARSGEWWGKSSAKKANAKDNGLAANRTHETAHLANTEAPSRLRVMAARAGAEQNAYEAPTGLATHHTLIWIQTLTARDSLTSVTLIARTRTKSVHHAENTEAESTRENQRNQGNTERKGVTDPRHLATLDAPSHPARRRKYRVPSRRMRNGSTSDSGLEQNGGQLSLLHDANINSADNSEDSDDPYKGLINTVQAQRNQQVAQAIGSGTASYFAQILTQFEDFYATAEKTGEDINSAFASIFNAGLRRQPNDKRLLELMEDYPRPGNVPLLIVPKTDEFAHNKLSKGPKLVDGLIQKIQTMMSKALVPLMR